MDRTDMLQWIELHPGAVHGEAADVTIRCEALVRRHAEEDAWLASRFLIDRIKGSEPPADWDGVWRFDSK